MFGISISWLWIKLGKGEEILSIVEKIMSNSNILNNPVGSEGKVPKFPRAALV